MDCNAGFTEAVARTIATHSLLQGGERIIVAVSGGADSVALLAVLVESGYACIAAHCNFHLRGDESQRDMLHTELTCRHLGVRLVVKDFDVAARMAATGESVEMACRNLRYEWFDELLSSERAAAIAVGHHREDNIETFLLNMLRGTGIDGLRGIRYRRGNIIRPLLDRSRGEIEEYLASQGLTFVVDSSNSSDKHLRNRLRNNVIPELIRNFPNAEDTLLHTMSNMNECGAVYDEAIKRYGNEYEISPMTFDIGRLAAEHPHCARTILFEIVKGYGITSSQCSDIIKSCNRSGLAFEGRNGLRLELDRGILRVAPSQPEEQSQSSFAIDPSRDINCPVDIKVSIDDISEFRPSRDASTLYLDNSALDGSPLWEIRHWRHGDRIKPFGMRGSKLVSDIFAEARYSAAQKREAWLLTRDGVILWVIGLRCSSHFPVSRNTKRFVTLKYIRRQ